MSSSLSATEQLDRVRAHALYAAAERLSFGEFASETSEFAGVGAREKVELFRQAIGVDPITGVRPRDEEDEP
jgi:hypothetical protein